MIQFLSADTCGLVFALSLCVTATYIFFMEDVYMYTLQPLLPYMYVSQMIATTSEKVSDYLQTASEYEDCGGARCQVPDQRKTFLFP